MTLIELKAAAYDCLAQIEQQQRELNRLNGLIAAEAAKPTQAPDENDNQ